MKLHTFESFVNTIKGSISERIEPIFEGGAAGHMMHPFDDAGLTFDDFRNMVEAGLSGELNFEEDPTEKTDGQNIFATVKDGKAMFARNKGQLKEPVDLNGIINIFAVHPVETVRDTFVLAATDIAKALEGISTKDQESYFNDGKNFMNMELIYSKNPNVIYYDRDVIQFHGIKKTDGEGNTIGDDNKPARSIAKAMQDLKINVGKTFTVIPPQIIKIGRDLNFEKNNLCLQFLFSP